ncbi:coproporphyrinogen III oxidase [Bacillus sp. OAE603]|uniref:coproporphyrinogen III oxidase n=1 Tax=Gottfriedia sp. OAE603 TaxID=2663872 RepID=UPI001789462B
MKIYIRGLDDHRFQRPLELLSQLFFEDCNVSLDEIEDADLEIQFYLDEQKMAVSGELGKDIQSNTTYVEGKDEKESFKFKKKAVNFVFLTLLQDHTKIEQKWGILTGIRPTKLLHTKLKNGMTKEMAHNELRNDYLIHEEKIQLMQSIVDRQLKVIPDLYNLENEVSIYIGIPYCPTKCAYCTFPAYAIQGKQGAVDSFLYGLHYEMEKVGEFLKERGINITTIYYGGGTPTSITAEEMDLLYAKMHESFPNMKNVREITVEAGRPDTITPEKLDVLNKWNIDRISINPQSYIQETLKAIGRHHTVDETITKFHLAREMGMNNINMDLIIGLPGEGLKEFQYTLDETKELMPESLTVHTLSFKRASEMTQNKQKYKVAEREEVQQMMNEATVWTEKHNYHPYYLYRQKNILGNLENIGYAVDGQESLYNILIMEEEQTIIGLGCGASSKFVHPGTRQITRFANAKDPKSYNDGYEHYTNAKIKILDELFSKK